MNRSVRTAIAAIGLAVVASTVTTPVLAADAPYNATIAGQRAFTPLVNLATSSVLNVDVVNLPANVGLYALHCKVPTDPRMAPTQCDSSTGALAYVTAEGALRPTVTVPLKVNGEFWGTNPNPTDATLPGSVDCRVSTGDPRSTTCAVYVLGAGRDAANPAYMRIWPTVFSPVRADRKTDVATIKLDAVVVPKGVKPAIRFNKAVPFSVTLASGLTPSLSSDNCSVTGGTITALKPLGTCTVRITSTGGKNYKPLVKTQVFLIRK